MEPHSSERKTVRVLQKVFIALVWIAAYAHGHADTVFPALFNVIWDRPSQDSLDSIPLSGRLGAGANVWGQDGSISPTTGLTMNKAVC
jgi:hypothetical protein